MKNLTYFFCSTLLLIASSANAQTQGKTLAQRLKYAADCARDRENSLRNQETFPAQASENKHMTSSRSGSDSDGDGMPDDWETANGLNPNNPADAWGDPDGDAVLSLFEYQLASNPKNSTTPQPINVSSSDDLQTILETAPEGALLRLQGGFYPLNYWNNIGSNAKRVMVQGGWNTAFTSRDICANKTVLDGQGNEKIFYISTDDGTYTLVLDGLTLQNGVDYPSANWLIGEANAICFWSFINCTFSQNPTDDTDSALKMNHWDDSESEAFIVNCFFTRNNGLGITNQTTQTATGKWQVINSVVSANGISAKGMDGFTLDNGHLDIQMTNDIIWGNGAEDLSFRGWGDFVTIQATRCDFGETSFGGKTSLSSTDSIDEDPLFTNPATGNFSISPNSPCFGTGLPIGLFLNGNAPNIGATACPSFVSGVAKTTTSAGTSLFPNPTNGTFSLTFSEETPDYITVLNALGQTVERRNVPSREESFNSPGKGVFFVKTDFGNGKSSLQRVVVQ